MESGKDDAEIAKKGLFAPKHNTELSKDCVKQQIIDAELAIEYKELAKYDTEIPIEGSGD